MLASTDCVDEPITEFDEVNLVTLIGQSAAFKTLDEGLASKLRDKLQTRLHTLDVLAEVDRQKSIGTEDTPVDIRESNDTPEEVDETERLSEPDAKTCDVNELAAQFEEASKMQNEELVSKTNVLVEESERLLRRLGLCARPWETVRHQDATRRP